MNKTAKNIITAGSLALLLSAAPVLAIDQEVNTNDAAVKTQTVAAKTSEQTNAYENQYSNQIKNQEQQQHQYKNRIAQPDASSSRPEVSSSRPDVSSSRPDVVRPSMVSRPSFR